VVVVGLARQGKAVARHFADRGASVVITDLRPANDLAPEMEELAGWPVEYFSSSPISAGPILGATRA